MTPASRRLLYFDYIFNVLPVDEWTTTQQTFSHGIRLS